ncbi:MAG TPA: ATP-dependent metallopeptidase FtsH/Yme1/Tma family protein, partial [Geoalkalibacter subterraneus]|nr:ATP-dependent metallopeptidase FtsH/Yme1/Tma family protein [Geoalkalibacter subterraneus]
MFSFKQFLILLIAVTIGVIAYNIWSVESKPPAIEYSSFLKQLENREIKSVHIRGGLVKGTDKHDQPFMTYAPDPGSLIEKMIAADVSFQASPPSTPSPFWHSTFPVLLLLGFWVFFMVRQRKGGGLGDFSKKKTRFAEVSKQKVTFDDVAGIPDAKEELIEIIHFLKDPGKYEKLGGKIPKGVLLQGPPGTGKTLLAKAIAGEAGVPFFNISGSEFIELFVGVGAARVREMFDQARQKAPCIIFIDEIDAIGRSRSGGPVMGGHDEREQTLNQLLTEMDGFDSSTGVVVMAATNRPEILDQALLRAGRFDRRILVDKPDLVAREGILRLYAGKMKLAPDVDLHVVAQRTPGFVGADLENICNEAAIHALREDRAQLTMADFEAAIDRVIAGPEAKSKVLNPEEKHRVAVHESGHALVAINVPTGEPVHRVTIIPRTIGALGFTLQLPVAEKYLSTAEEMKDQIAILLGGRIAEELVLGSISSGAANDLEKATEIARTMIARLGMSENLGPVVYGRQQQLQYLNSAQT